MVLKIDLEKAYDWLSWDFIKDTLKEIGLCHDLLSNIMACIEKSKLVVLWHGEQLDWFTIGRGHSPR